MARPNKIISILFFQLVGSIITYEYAKRILEEKPYIWLIASLLIPPVILWVWLYIRKRKRLNQTI